MAVGGGGETGGQFPQVKREELGVGIPPGGTVNREVANTDETGETAEHSKNVQILGALNHRLNGFLLRDIKFERDGSHTLLLFKDVQGDYPAAGYDSEKGPVEVQTNFAEHILRLPEGWPLQNAKANFEEKGGAFLQGYANGIRPLSQVPNIDAAFQTWEKRYKSTIEMAIGQAQEFERRQRLTTWTSGTIDAGVKRVDQSRPQTEPVPAVS